MEYDGYTRCPDCGSEDAVAKHVAWDALTKTSPKVERELHKLRTIRDAADAVVEEYRVAGYSMLACIIVPEASFKRLINAVLRDYDND